MGTRGQTDDQVGSDSEPTVLFVDDETELLNIYELKFSREYTVLTATGGEEALERFDDHIDFAFFDRRMPDLSGDEAIVTLREQGYDTPVGIVSAVDPEQELPVEPEVYFTKPVDTEQIRSTVDQCI